MHSDSEIFELLNIYNRLNFQVKIQTNISVATKCLTVKLEVSPGKYIVIDQIIDQTDFHTGSLKSDASQQLISIEDECRQLFPNTELFWMQHAFFVEDEQYMVLVRFGKWSCYDYSNNNIVIAGVWKVNES